MWAVFAVVIFAMLAIFNTDRDAGEEVSYTEYISRLEDSAVRSVERNNVSGDITFV